MTDQEINEAVARKLGCSGYSYHKHEYCRSIEAAWEVVENIRKERMKQVDMGYGSDNKWRVSIYGDFVEAKEFGIVEADTAPMAICLAFLKLK